MTGILLVLIFAVIILIISILVVITRNKKHTAETKQISQPATSTADDINLF